MSDQLTFEFPENPGHSQGAASGLDRWRAERRAASEALAEKLGVPLGLRVRADFHNGPSLSGILCLDHEALFIESRRDVRLPLRIGTSSFHFNEVAAFVRLDSLES